MHRLAAPARWKRRSSGKFNFRLLSVCNLQPCFCGHFAGRRVASGDHLRPKRFSRAHTAPVFRSRNPCSQPMSQADPTSANIPQQQSPPKLNQTHRIRVMFGLTFGRCSDMLMPELTVRPGLANAAEAKAWFRDALKVAADRIWLAWFAPSNEEARAAEDQPFADLPLCCFGPGGNMRKAIGSPDGDHKKALQAFEVARLKAESLAGRRTGRGRSVGDAAPADRAADQAPKGLRIVATGD